MEKTPLLLSFGKKVRILREAKGLSQEGFSFLVGVHRTYIGMIERGEKNITLTNIYKIAKALDVTISELLKDI